MRVTLEESTHTYRNELGEKYTPVSNVIAAYKQPFDAVSASIDYAYKHGGTPEYWQQVWANAGDFGSKKGTAFHNLKEDFVANSAFFKHDIALSPVYNWKLLRETKPGFTYSDLPVGTYTELTIANHLRRIAGTADLVTILPDRWVDIDDYKTNKVLKTEGFRGKTMKAPVHTLQDCHLSHYTIQLNIYGWMLVQYGFRIRRMRLLHYDMTDEHVKSVLEGKAVHDLEPTIHPIQYWGDHAGKLLDHYCTHKRKGVPA